MKNKVLVFIRLAATLESYEMKVPYDLCVGQVANLAARLLAMRESPRYVAAPVSDLMFVDGAFAGTVIDPRVTVRELVVRDELVDGQTLALV